VRPEPIFTQPMFNPLAVPRYENGCACGEHVALTKNYVGDIRSLHAMDFDAVKLGISRFIPTESSACLPPRISHSGDCASDGCGAQRNMTLYAELMRESGKNYSIENCHWGRCTASDDSSCPVSTRRPVVLSSCSL
jgi:hypothetical protein